MTNELTKFNYTIASIVFVCVSIALFSAPHVIFAAHDKDETVATGDVMEEIDVIAVIPKLFPPQYSIDELGEPYGFAIDVMNEVAKRANINLTYQIEETWSEVLQVMRDGEADVIPNIGITDERDEYLDFTIPMEAFSVSIFVRADSKGIESVDDLRGKHVAIVEENVAVTLLQNKGMYFEVFQHPYDAFFELLSGNVDALAYPQPVMLRLTEDTGLSDKIQVVGEPLEEIKRGIAVAEGDVELQQRLDQALRQFLETEEYHEMYVKWFAEPAPYWTAARVASFAGIMIGVVMIMMVAWRYVSISKLNTQLQKFAKHSVGREEKMIELKKELKKYKDTSLD